MSRHKLVEAAPIGKPSKQLRILRVGWHDTAALFREFRQPLIIFLLAVFVGGYIYMTLNNDFSDNDPLKLVDMPYIMLALMLLEASIEAPDEPYLIVFWCIQPLLAVYIVGRGAADFLRLFINREERRSAWEAVVASTFKRHIIVVGIGHTGLRIARELTQMGFEVVAVDLGVSRKLMKPCTILTRP